jgi:hypothetical protein
LHDPAPFDPDVHNKLTIEEKFESCKRAIHSIRDTLSPESPDLENVNIIYIDTLKAELSEYLKMFSPEVDAFSAHPMNINDIEFIHTNCKDASSVHEAIIYAITWLRVARDALKTIEDNKRNAGRFDIKFKFDYYQCLQISCCDALTMALENM